MNQLQQQPAVDEHHLSTQYTPLMPTSALINPSSSIPPPPPPKKKRSLPGQPDPDAEVIALSPTSLLATNRFKCEICNKGFQRDQNLQLHRRGHNLPWKLKQRETVVRKKVYVCPEPGCVHNDPARALGDYTGIKKHFYRKHGERKWQCEKCYKKYAVHSDWKAHSKTCGAKDYKCHCGALFSRRDIFITHRALCNAMVTDTARAITSNPFLPAPSPPPTFILQNPANPENMHTHIPNSIPAWLEAPPMMLSSSSFSPALLFNQEPMQPPPLPQMSATALLQKAAQLGAIVSGKTASTSLSTHPPPMATSFGLDMFSLEHEIGSNNIGFFANEGLRPLIPHADIANLSMDGLPDTNVASSSSYLEHEKAW